MLNHFGSEFINKHIFSNFYADMGDTPAGKSLERRNNALHYGPTNCYWATRTEQANNMRSNRLLDFDGVRKTMAEWARETGHPPLRILQRLQRGWSVERALTTPSLRGKALHINEL